MPYPLSFGLHPPPLTLSRPFTSVNCGVAQAPGQLDSPPVIPMSAEGSAASWHPVPSILRGASPERSAAMLRCAQHDTFRQLPTGPLEQFAPVTGALVSLRHWAFVVSHLEPRMLNRILTRKLTGMLTGKQQQGLRHAQTAAHRAVQSHPLRSVLPASQHTSPTVMPVTLSI